MRIGISGTQSSGKTTLLNALRSEKMFTGYHVGTETTRRVKSYGLSINEQGSDLTQRLIMQEHIVNVFMYDKLLTDRTSLDCLVYTQELLHTNKNISDQTMHLIESMFLKVQPQYDIQFYLEPEFALEDDGVRSIDIGFRDRITDRFTHAISEYGIKVVKLSGSVRERLNQVFEIVKQMEK